MRYTEAQAQAISTIDRNLQIIAGAGSGKTQVIAARAVNILSMTGIHPRNIVAFTFTEKAAAELKARIARLTRDELGHVDGLAEMYVGTIHGFCLDFLQNYLYEFLKFQVLSEIQAKLLVGRNSQQSGLASVEVIKGPSKGESLSRHHRNVNLFLSALDVLREDAVDLEGVPEALRQGVERYTELLDKHRYLDYSRLQVEAVKALRDTEDDVCIKAQQRLSERVKYLIVDEYQDVNPLQEDLISRIHELGANLCVVGDDDQTIYQWRGSEVRNIIEFQDRYGDVESVTLGRNFRSSVAVVNTASIIAEAMSQRLDKDLESGEEQRFERGDLLALKFDGAEDEGDWIATKIKSMLGTPFTDSKDSPERGLSWSDFSILLRSVKKNAEPIIEALRRHGVPFVVKGFGNLFETDEVIAAVALFRYIGADKMKEEYAEEYGISEHELRALWRAAELGVTDRDLDRGMEVLEGARNVRPGSRWAVYNIQRTYLDFLEAVGLREENVLPTSAGGDRGEVAYFNLGKFSQVISDFEQIYFKTDPETKYPSFLYWIEKEAPGYYEEGTDSAGYAQPDAVQIMTIHQAKGMEWPAVFIPALLKNRFPSGGVGGRTLWHLMPRECVPHSERYDGSLDDERRLFYVALTRAKKYLFCTTAPLEGFNNRYTKTSPFFQEFSASHYVTTRDPGRQPPHRLQPRPRRETPEVILSFSELKYFYLCPYQFKLRFLYGFNPPIHEALGFGKSLHDALTEVHKQAIEGHMLAQDSVDDLIDRHLHLPFAYPELAGDLEAAARDAVSRYLRRNRDLLPLTEHAEKQVEIHLDSGITVNGRIDLIRRLDTDEISIVDFKSNERSQEEEVTESQLHTYALGYQDLTGRNADLVEVLNLDERGEHIRTIIDDSLLNKAQNDIREVGESIRNHNYLRLKRWCSTCDACDLSGICRDRPRVAKLEEHQPGIP